MKRTAVAVSLLLLAGLLTGCGKTDFVVQPNGDKVFGDRVTADGAHHAERIEFPDGSKRFDVTHFPDGTEKMARIEYPGKEKQFDVTVDPDHTVRIARIEYSDGKVTLNSVKHPSSSNNPAAAPATQRNSFTFNQNIELLSARNDELERLNSIDFFRDRNVQFHCGQTGCDNTTLFVDTGSEGRWLPGQKMPGTEEDMGLWTPAEKDEFVCALAEVELRQSIFENVMVSETHTDRLGVTKGKFQGIILLPTNMPAGCKLPPDVDGFR